MILLGPVIGKPKNSHHGILELSINVLRALQQEEHLEKERARLNALRERDEDRAKRFMNAKNRSIGVDKSYLDKQIEEKRLLELAQREEKLVDGKYVDVQF